MKPQTALTIATILIYIIELTFYKQLGYGKPIPALGIIATFITVMAWASQRKDTEN